MAPITDARPRGQIPAIAQCGTIAVMERLSHKNALSATAESVTPHPNQSIELQIATKRVVAIEITGADPIIILARAFGSPNAAEVFIEAALDYQAGRNPKIAEATWSPLPETVHGR